MRMCVCIYTCIKVYVSMSSPLALLLHTFLHNKGSNMEDYKGSEDHAAPANSHDHEAAPIDKKYGGLVPKKKPLISKDNQRAFFDSADWALYKQGAGIDKQSTVAIETLQPKLQRTPHQQLPPRRPACTS